MILLATTALALDPTPVTVIAPAEPVPDPAALTAALARAGGSASEVWTGARLEAEVQVVVLSGRIADGDCGGPVDLAEWRTGLDEARTLLQVIALDEAVAAYVAREIEVPCLVGAPAGADLLEVELGLATAHHFLALDHSDDPVRSRFHAAESDRALERAVAVGRGLPLPPDADAEIAQEWSAALGLGATGSLRVWAPAGLGLRVDGRPVGDGVLVLPSGTHLVQAVDGAAVVVAGLVDLPRDGRRLVWIAAEGSAPPGLAEAVTALAGPPDPVGDALLAAAGGLLSGPVVYAVTTPEGVSLWEPADGSLVPRGAGRVRSPPRRSFGPWAVQLGVGGAGSTIGGGPLEGLGGVGPGAQVGVAYHLGETWQIGATLRPSAVPRRLAPWEGGGLLFRATLPVLLAGGWSREAGPWRVELGLEAGPHLFGAFDEFRLGALVLGRVGLARTFGGRTWWAEGWGGPGSGYVAAGVSGGVRWRL